MGFDAMRAVLPIALAACNQIYGIDETRLRTDGDGDGLLDVDDNCPDVANPDQRNEDLDAFGDRCDPCPGTPGEGDDTDGDGLGDACDPTAMTDCLALFETFSDDNALASWKVLATPTAMASVSNGRLRIEANNTDEVAMFATGFNQGGVEIGGFAIKNGPAAFFGAMQGVTTRMDGTPSSGIACGLLQSDTESELRIYDATNDALIDSAGFTFAAADANPPLQIRLVTEGSTFACAIRLVYFGAYAMNVHPQQLGEVGLVATSATSIVDYFAVYTRPPCPPTIYR